MKRLAFAAFALLVFCASAAPAQEAEDVPFEKLLGQWEKYLDRIEELENEQQRIQQEIQATSEKAEALLPQLAGAAEAVYRQNPGGNPAVAEILSSTVRRAMNEDDYETAARLGKLLSENEEPDPDLYHVTGLASYAVSDYDTAEKYLRKAAEARRIGQLGAHWLQNIEKTRVKWDREAKLRQQEAKADNLPRVELKTTAGDITVELFENEAPNTVANFVSLVEDGFYDGLTFHRVLDGFMAQAGCPKGDGTGGPGYHVPCECQQENHRNHFRGSLSMAHAGRDTGGSQFFLTFIPTSHLDGHHTVFGRVIEGMDVLAELQRRDPTDPNAPEPDKINSAKVLRKRDHAYEPKKLPADEKPEN